MRTCAFLIVLMFFGAVMEAVGIGALYPLITIIGTADFLTKHEKIKNIVSIMGVNTQSQFIILCSLALIAFYAFKNLFTLLQTRMQIRFSMNNQKDYTKRLYSYYLSKPYLYHVNTNSSVLVRNITSGGRIVFADILVSTLSIITELITVLIIWIMLLVVDWFIAIVVALLLGPLVYLILRYFRKRITKQGELQNKCVSDYTKWLYQGLGAIKETKVMQKEEYFTTEFNRSYSEYSDSSRDFMYIDKVPRVLVELTGIGGILLLVIIKIATGVDPQSIVPSLGVLALAAVRLMPSVNRIISLFNTIKFNMPLFNEIFPDLLIIKNKKDMDEQHVAKNKETKMPFEKEISVEHLSFHYPDSKTDILRDISFSIPKGKFIGIIGPSGAGKTTFVDILLGLLPPTQGNIFVDGEDIYKNTSSWLYNIAYVPQTIYLIDGTIRENIALGIPNDEVDNDKIERVLKMSELYTFVNSMPEKEYTKAGERGVKLSGGQKQRIGIARALYNDPSVLILDEATSSLDNETEKSITSTILKLKGTLTIIAIAHRLSTLEDCDLKIKLENGMINNISRNISI